MRRWALDAQHLFVRKDRVRAREAHDQLVRQLPPDESRRRQELRNRYGRYRSGNAILGLARDPSGTSFRVGMPVSQLLSLPVWVSGASGSGKSFFILSVLLQLLQRRLPVIIFDMKGELSQIVQETVLPALAGGSPGTGVTENLRIIRPFGTPWIPELRLTARESGVSLEVQALSLAQSLEEALGADLGIRMERVWIKLVMLAIDLNEPLTILSRWLSDPTALSRDGMRSGDPQLRRYACVEFVSEIASSRQALLARLDSFLLLPETRQSLSAERCFSFGPALATGVTIINLGEPPAGAERVARFWAGVLVGRLSRAILTRAVSEGTPPVLVVLEEFQEALSGSQTEQFKRLLSLARYKRVSPWFVNQQAGQLSSIDPSLPKLLRTNTGMEILFRASAEDARAVAFPRELHRRSGSGLDLVRLPNRQAFLWLKAEPFGPQRIRSLDVDLTGLREVAQSMEVEEREIFQRGTVAVPRLEPDADTRTGVVPGRSSSTSRPQLPTRPGRFPRLG